MTLDRIHIGVTALLWIIGLIYITATVSKVGPVRRVAYFLAVPIWLGWSILYTARFFSPLNVAELSAAAIASRVLLFGLALEGLLVPFVDRLELKRKPQEVRITK